MYDQTIGQIHAQLARLTDQVSHGVHPQSLLDSYVVSARKRSDWVEPAPERRVFGIPVQPCGTTDDHDWHSNGARFCPGYPDALDAEPTAARLIAGRGLLPA